MNPSALLSAIALWLAATAAEAVSLSALWIQLDRNGNPTGIQTEAVVARPGDFLYAEFFLDPAGAPGGVSAYDFNILFGSPLDRELSGWAVSDLFPFPFTIDSKGVGIDNSTWRLTGIDRRTSTAPYSGLALRVASGRFRLEIGAITDGIDVSAVFDSPEQGVFDGQGLRVPVEIRGISVNAIPEPAALELLLLGLCALAAGGRAQSSSAAR
jgi:hypothetical protein